MSEKDTVILFHPLPWESGNKKARLPYALLFLERNIRDLGLNIVLIDEFTEPDYEPILRQYSERTLLLGVSTMTGMQLRGAISISEMSKSISDAPIVWGGWHPTILPEQTLESDFIDYVIMGQGEEPLRQLLIALINKSDVSDIRGLGFKVDGKAVINPREKYKDAFSFPKVDFTKMDIHKYISTGRFAKRSIRYFTTQGCPYKCGFCSLALVYERKWSHKSVAEIIEELEYLKKVGDLDGIKFDDDNFFVNREFVMELCREMINRKLNLKWITQGHASHFLKHYKEEDFALMYEAGARLISIGAESGDQVVLNLIAKNNKVEDNISCTQMFHRNGIESYYTTMVCFPINPERDFYATLNMLMDAKLIDPRFNTYLSFFTPYPGTDVYEMSVKSGYIPPQSLQEWSLQTWKRSRMPWVDKKLYRVAWMFMDFYLPLGDPKIYTYPRWFLRPFVLIIRLMFYDLVRWRFKHKNLKYPIEAVIVLYSIRILNKLLRTHLKLRVAKEGFFD